MANRDHHNKPFTSGVHTDLDFMDIDEVMIVPDTPDRVSNSKQPENIRKISSKNRRFGPSSSRHVLVSRPKDRYHYNDQAVKDDRVSLSSFERISHDHHHDHNSSKNPIMVKNGDIAKFSPKLKNDDFGARKVGKLCPDRSNVASLNINGASSKSTKSDNNGKMKGNDNICLITSNKDSVFSHSRIDNKGKVKMNVDRDEPIRPISSSYDNEKFSSPSFRVPSNNNRKRLVRNGCISPHNIVKVNKREDKSGIGMENGEGVEALDVSRPIIDVNEATSKQKVDCRAKGKGLSINDSSSMGHESGKSGAKNSTNERHKGKFLEDCIIVGNTHDNSNKTGINRNNSPFPSTSLVNKSMLSEVWVRTPSESFRRPKKISGSSEKGKDVIFLSSGGESSTVKPLRNHGGFSGRELGSSLARADFCVEEERESVTESNNDEREIQLQEDEKLARELQEQLYNETPIFTSVERVSSLGTEEREENRSETAFLHNAHDSDVPPSSFRLPAPQSLRARLFRRSQARLTRSNLSRIRSQLYNYPSGRHNLLSHMDIDSRMNYLESLEAVYNEDISMVNQLLNSDREFDENDYEMLSTLDENNHSHLGASIARIASLPVSTINNDNCEICSICLETPVIGDTMRHLPCLHKFHRECIDLWLRRKRACPICKSDV